jgi:uncharacterized membrane protein YoaK (UPF0700 family)
MAPITVIVIFLAIQIVGYIILDKFNLSKWKLLILAASLISYIFFLPSYFIPDIPDNEPKCAMPGFAITFVFWIFGCGTTIIAHFIYTACRCSKIKP